MKRWNNHVGVFIAVSGLLVALSVACGGRQDQDDGTGASTDGSGPGSYSQAVQADFAKAYQSYQQASQGGMTEDECERAADNFSEVHEDSGSGVPEALFNAGMVWDQCKNASKAREFFEEANKVSKRHSQKHVDSMRKAGKKAGEVAPGYAPSYIQLGVYAYRDGDKGQAKRNFDLARDSDRRSFEAYTNLGILERESKSWSDAQLNLRRALAVNSDYMTAFAQMALLYLEVAEENRQMLDIVELVSQQATGRAAEIKADPLDLAPIHNIWGLALIRQGDVVGSVKQFDTARRLDPSFFEAHMNYGAVNLSFRGFSAAEDAFRKAVALHPDDYQASLSLGAALRGLEKFGEARSQYEKARQLDAKAPGAYYNLGVLMQDYEMSSAGGMDAQIALLGKAKQLYRDFLSKCQTRARDCMRKRPGESDTDMRATANRRIKACDETINGLRQAKKLAAEAERLERQSAQQQKQGN